ncbi:membrane bound O-acyl transferase family-domain-containing protein [Trametes elegans]|nr:membrane bound O-acyl transferase family-domain-containing protein [Trametes elegans]
MADANSTAPFAYEKVGRPMFPAMQFTALFDLALACVIAVRPPVVIRVGAGFLLLYAVIYATMTYTVGDPTNDYAVGTVLGVFFLNALTLVCLSDPLKEIRYVGDNAPLTEKPLLERIWYGLCLVVNYRLVGTTAEVPNVPPPYKGMSRTRYVLMRLRELLVCLIVIDLMEAYTHTHPQVYEPGAATEHFPPGPIGYLMYTLSVAAWLAIVFFSMKLSYTVATAAIVAFHLGKPEAWPDMFGSYTDAYTIGRVWGCAWHQQLRRHFIVGSRWVNDMLGVPRGTWLNALIRINVAFALSGIAHSIGDLMLGNAHFGRSWPFFAVNGIAVTIESLVFSLSKRAGIKGDSRTLRWLGYVYVYLWFTYSGPLYQQWMFENECSSKAVIPYSPTRHIIIPYLRSVGILSR